VPAVYGLAFVAGWGPTGIWVGMALGNVLGAIAAVLWFTRGTWKDVVIDEETETAPESPDVADAPEGVDPVEGPDTSGPSEGK
jgi:hypothetical protein